MSKPYEIYLSSTLKDLEEERTAVLDLLTKVFGFSVKHSYSASENDLVASCLEDVASSRAYIGIIGMRYGYVPPNRDGKSITQLEFEHARKHNLPCYIFIKRDDASTYKPNYLDSHTKENLDGALIKELRSRLENGKEIRPHMFASADDLKIAVAGKVAGLQRSIEGTSPLLRSQRRNAAEMTHDVGLIMVPGTDDAALRRFGGVINDNRFKLIQVSPAESAYTGLVDNATRTCRSICWVLSPQSIGRFKASPQVLRKTLETSQFRFGTAFAALIEGASVHELDPTWRFAHVIAAKQTTTATQHLEDVYATVRSHVPQVYPDRRISIPVMVLALTQAEASLMVGDPQQLMNMFPGKECPLRLQQFEDMRNAIVNRFPRWPDGFYGNSREDWRPFGQPHPTAEALLADSLGRINDDVERSSRERLLLAGEDIKLHLRRYSFDEYLTDTFGSRTNLDRIRKLGCLLLVDEMALLHPVLRERAHEFLLGQRIAVMCINPCDPAVTATPELLGELSFRRVGALRERFCSALDPRCELAINSTVRAERWLRLILPELVSALGQIEPQQDLLNNTDQLFHTPVT